MIAALLAAIVLTSAATADADNLAGRVSRVMVYPPSISNIRAGLVLETSSGPVFVDFVGGIYETASHPTLNRRELSTRLAIVAAAKNDPFNNRLTLNNVTRVSTGYYQANRNSTLETRFQADNRWLGVVEGVRATHSFANQDVLADNILGVGIAKEPNKPFDVEYVIVRIGNESWNVLCLGDPIGVQLDTNVWSTTPMQREHLMTLAAQYKGRMHFLYARQFGSTGFYLHSNSWIERID
jgi:hypothetical protein